MGLKECSKCGQVLSASEFHKRIASHDGLSFKCKQCVNSYTEAWRADNPDAHKKWYAANKSRRSIYGKSWRRTHEEHRAKRMQEWSRKHAGLVNSKNARRVASKLKAIPIWANHELIRLIYANAAKLRLETGGRYEVDHIVPLQGKTVCGLHWEGNLQILTKFDNISKHNREWPGMVS